MKALFSFFFIVIAKTCFSQGFLIYDANDYIKPSWLNPKYLGMDSVSKIYYLSVFGGTGFNVSSVSGDGVYPNLFYNTFWVSSSLYFGRTQLGLKGLYQFGGTYRKKNDAYAIYQNINPKIQFAFYPKLYGKSYLNDQLRLRLSWAASFISNTPDKPANYTSAFHMEYGGFITNSAWKTSLPKTALNAYFIKGVQKDFSTSYGMALFTALPYHPINVNNTIYLQVGYNRQRKEGIDKVNLLRLGLVNELYYNKTGSSVMYIFVNYTTDYFVGTLTPEGNNLKEKTHTINIGLFLNFPFYSDIFYESNMR